MNPPSLPTHMSLDGREVWDWAAQMGAFIARDAKIAELRKGICELRTRCGTCQHWMKSSECPRETPTPSGHPRGPTMNDYPCNLHVEEKWVTELRNQREAELAALNP